MAGPIFFSEEWVKAAKDAINAWPPEDYKNEKLFLYWMWMDAAKPHVNATWALGVKGVPPEGRDLYAAFTFEKGMCIDTKHVGAAEAAEANFLLRGDYQRWKDMMQGYDVGKSIMYRKLMLDGDVHGFFRTIYFYSESLIAMTRIPMSFPEELAA